MAHTKQLQQKIHQKLQSGQFEAHTLESLPLTHLFHVLWEGSTNWCLTHRVSRPAQDKSSFLLRRIPDTVVWENNIPKGWYRYEEEMEEGTDGQKVKVGNIKKDKVDTKKVDYSFTNGKHDDDIVAMYLAKALDGVKEIIRIDYLTTTNLRAFLFSRNRGKGTCLLQRWVEPQNREFNDVIQAVWTSSLKCLVERRRVCHFFFFLSCLISPFREKKKKKKNRIKHTFSMKEFVSEKDVSHLMVLHICHQQQT